MSKQKLRKVEQIVAQNDDRAIILRAMLLGVARWEWFTGTKTSGEFCFGGLRRCWALDDQGVPVIPNESSRQELINAVHKAEDEQGIRTAARHEK